MSKLLDFDIQDAEALTVNPLGYDQNQNSVLNLSPFRRKMSHRSPVFEKIKCSSEADKKYRKY